MVGFIPCRRCFGPCDRTPVKSNLVYLEGGVLRLWYLVLYRSLLRHRRADPDRPVHSTCRPVGIAGQHPVVCPGCCSCVVSPTLPTLVSHRCERPCQACGCPAPCRLRSSKRDLCSWALGDYVIPCARGSPNLVTTRTCSARASRALSPTLPSLVYHRCERP